MLIGYKLLGNEALYSFAALTRSIYKNNEYVNSDATDQWFDWLNKEK